MATICDEEHVRRGALINRLHHGRFFESRKTERGQWALMACLMKSLGGDQVRWMETGCRSKHPLALSTQYYVRPTVNPGIPVGSGCHSCLM